MLLSPAFTFSIAISSLYGLIVHLFSRGDLQKLPVYVFASLVGFGIGQGIGRIMAIETMAIGQVNMVAGTFGSIIALITVSFLMAGRRTT